MKKSLTALLAFVAFFQVARSQDNDNIKQPTLGVQFFLNDFKGANYIRTHSLSAALNDKQLGRIQNMNAGLALNYINGLSKHFDFTANIAASFLDYPYYNGSTEGTTNLLLETDISVIGKMFPDNYVVSPYLQAGLGVSKYKGYYGGYMPLGVGLQFNVSNETFVFVNSQYRVPITTSVVNYHFYHSIGISGNIGHRKSHEVILPPPPPPVVVPPKDTDGDGIVDSLDACPLEAGSAALKGCPDRDHDGIADKDDKCPDVPGVARYQGCPIPDRDHDGINDEEDKCPDVPGVARYQGCPIPDRDKDGVNDEEDKCPDIPGDASNAGCPVIKEDVRKKIEFAAQHIFFATGKSTLLKASFKPLNNVVAILKENKDVKLDIDGYTDNTGKADKNQTLSQARAEAVKKYLTSKGVEDARLGAAGHGQDNPIADNKKAAGRAKNRRVELHLKYY